MNSLERDDDLQGWAHQQEILHQRWLAESLNYLQESCDMSLTVKDKGNDFLPPPEGLHIARCYAVIDLGVQINQTYGNSSPKVLIGWELTDVLMEGGKPFIQMQRYTASLSEKSNLRSLLEAWRGKSFTADELKGFQLKNILSATCYLTTKHDVNPTTHKKWSKVISICKLPPTIPCPSPINQPIYFDLDEYSEVNYFAVPESIRKKINLSGIAKPPITHSSEQHEEDFDQDIPF